MIARDPLRLAAARLAAEYVSRAATWAGDVDQALVIDLEGVHRRIVHDIDEMLAGEEQDREVSWPARRVHVGL